MKQNSPFYWTIGAALALNSVSLAAGAQSPPAAPPQFGNQDFPPGGVPVPAAPRAQQPGDPYIARPAQSPQPGLFPGMPGMPGFGPMVMSQTPEMAKKTLEIMALREMLRLRLTSQDITAALTPLHELRDAEKTLQSRSERILEDEKKALLAAASDEAPPLESGDRMRQAIGTYRDRQEKTWSALVQSIGPEKTNGLRRLLGLGGVPQPGFPGNPDNSPFAPDPRGGTLFPGRDIDPALGGQRRAPRRAVPVNPVPGAVPGTPDSVPLPPSPRAEEDPTVQPPAPDTAPRAIPRGQQPPQPDTIPVLLSGEDPFAQTSLPADQPNGFFPQQPAAVPQVPGGARPATPRPPRRNQVNPPPAGYYAGPQGQPGGDYYPRGGTPVPRLTLAELITLLEQKQGAMRKP